MIESLKDLEKLFKLCRKQGIIEANLTSMTFKFGDLPFESTKSIDIENENPYQNFPQGELTPEQLMYYSTGGLPEDDPVLKAQAS